MSRFAPAHRDMPYDASNAEAGATASTPTPTPTRRSDLAIPTLKIVKRDAWNAEAMRNNFDPMKPIDKITVHHTDVLADMASKTDAELVRAVQVMHQDDRGWADVGYHYLIGREGTIFEGRTIQAQGAHAGGGNNVGNVGASLIGNFEDARPTTAALTTLDRVLAHHVLRYNFSADAIYGHRDFKATECPGNALYAWLGEWKQALRAREASGWAAT